MQRLFILSPISSYAFHLPGYNACFCLLSRSLCVFSLSKLVSRPDRCTLPEPRAISGENAAKGTQGVINDLPALQPTPSDTPVLLLPSPRLLQAQTDRNGHA